MARSIFSRILAAAVLVAAEAAVATMFVAMASAPAGAQLFDDRFPFQNRRQQQRGPFDWFGQPQPQYQPREREREREREEAPPDFSRAPPAKKADAKSEAAVQTPIMVFGDAMADWLAYGLELAYSDTPEIGVLRRHRTNSGLIRTEVRNDPRGEYPDWPQAAREMIAAQKPKFVLMMIGVNDRRQIRETVQAVRAAKPAPAEDPAALELDKSAAAAPQKPAEPPAAAAPEPPPAPGGNRTLEFRTDAWSEAYIRRIDDTIAALKTSGVPVFWVGLPPLRGQKLAADVPFLNDLYRSRADKAGIIFIDVWDGFVDEEGRFAQSGPDLEGQIRRLRAGDGVYFTQAGARKLAHYVEREVQRWLSSRATPVALPVTEEPKVDAAAAAARPGTGHARPLAGPTLPLAAERAIESDELLGGNARQPAADAIVAKVLVKGEALPVPAGRADDFAWPRRGVAPVGSDPVVATTDLPMTPMLAEKAPGAGGSTPAAAATSSTEVASAAAQPAARPVRRATPRPSYADAQSVYRPDYRPNYQQRQWQPFSFGGLFGGRW
jgi:uncharacterized protein